VPKSAHEITPDIFHSKLHQQRLLFRPWGHETVLVKKSRAKKLTVQSVLGSQQLNQLSPCTAEKQLLISPINS